VDLFNGAAHVRFRRQATVAAVLVALLALAAPVAAAPKGGPLKNFKHLVVIYEENHSFDNLYGMWGDVNGQAVYGLDDAANHPGHVAQVDWAGNPYTCLLQTDIGLRTSIQAYPVMTSTSTLPNSAVGEQVENCTQDVPLQNTIGSPTTAHISSAFNTNEPYLIDDYIPSDAETCPDLQHLFSYSNGIVDGYGSPGGCTRDLVHRFYQEQYAINAGNQNRYITASDSAAMTFGYYDTTQLPIYKYLHGNGAPKYVIADHFFQAAFGGSFLNHQFLIAAAAPDITGASGAVRSVLDPAGMVRGRSVADGCPSGSSASYPLYKTDYCVVDGNETQACAGAVGGLACGNYAVNTVLPFYQPTSSIFANQVPMIDDSTTDLTIGDLMTDGGVSWAYYGGGWDNASGNTTGLGWTAGPGPSCDAALGPLNGAALDGAGHGGYPYCPHYSYQQHHYPFAYFSRYNSASGPDRVHLQDEQDFFYAVANGQLPQVSFVKPLGIENEHPGYASEPNGSDHLVDLIQSIMNGPQAGSTLIVVTYDEFGGQWDHVPPPSDSNDVAAHDWWGPGTRIPALILGRGLTRSGVDHTYYDTLSIMRTIEVQWGLGNLGLRDADVNNLGPAISAGLRH
jgi:acid phosphatase